MRHICYQGTFSSGAAASGARQVTRTRTEHSTLLMDHNVLSDFLIKNAVVGRQLKMTLENTPVTSIRIANPA
jgi:hypothetical protein